MAHLDAQFLAEHTLFRGVVSLVMVERRHRIAPHLVELGQRFMRFVDARLHAQPLRDGERPLEDGLGLIVASHANIEPADVE